MTRTRPTMAAVGLAALTFLTVSNPVQFAGNPHAAAASALSVSNTSLSQDTTTSDLSTLKSLFSQHTGDGASRGPDQLVYNVDVKVDPANHEIACHLIIHFHNNLQTPIPTLYFNVWPDAPHFRKSGGAVSISNLQMAGAPQPFTLHGTVLTVNLTQPVKVGASGVISMDYSATLPNVDDRYGWEGTTMNFGNWFPVLAVHDAYGWITPPYYSDGESFYSLTGAFHVHLTAPDSLVVAVSGDRSSHTENTDGTYTDAYNAIGVRDVAMVGNTDYQVISGNVGSVVISTYYSPEQDNQAKLMLSVGENAVRFYNAHYGPYPYKTLKICAMHGWFGGMEYPQLVMISFQPDGNTVEATTTDVAHEVAHQWFYGMVGDDQYLTPWLDESFATFSEARFDKLLDGFEDVPETPYHASYSVSAFANSDFPAKSGNSGGDPSDYYTAVYMKGASALNDLYLQIGASRFDALMKGYFAQYQYQVATSQDFIGYVSKFTGKDMTKFFQEYGIFANDDLKSPSQSWVKIETSENQRNWH